MTHLPYRTLSLLLRERFGERVQKITLDAGLSCPHRDADKKGGCIYCNAKGSGTGAHNLGKSLEDQIEEQILIMNRRYGARRFIAYFQSYSNTYGELPLLKGCYDVILAYPQIAGLSIGTRPDCIDEEKLKLIEGYADRYLVWMEYGLQSGNDETLTRINRGHDVKTFVEAVELTARFNLRQCAHVIIGLPGEGMDDYLSTARLISSLPVTDIKIHLLYVVRDTPLAAMFHAGGYAPLSLEEYSASVVRFIALLRKDIVIQRITGDPHPEELVEPRWALRKGTIRQTIHQEFDRSGITQGCMLG